MDIKHYTATTIFLTIIILAVLFLIIRQLVLWYWKINHINSKLESIDEHLEQIAELLSAKFGPNGPSEELIDHEPPNHNVV